MERHALRPYPRAADSEPAGGLEARPAGAVTPREPGNQYGRHRHHARDQPIHGRQFVGVWLLARHRPADAGLWAAGLAMSR